MRKFIVCLIIMNFALPSQAAFWDSIDFPWFNRKDKALEKELDGKGYAGKLPDLGRKIEKTKTKVSTPIFDSQEGFDNPSDLKPIPESNPAYINIIQKKEKIPQFLKDTDELIPILEKLVDCIENKESLQLFITKANFVSMNIEHFTKKYEGQPESYYESYIKLQDVNRYVKSISTLRREAVTYQKYLAYSSTGSIYNPENIEEQLQYLVEELNSTILYLREQI